MIVVAHLLPNYREIDAEVVAAALSLAYRWGEATPGDRFLKSQTLRGHPVHHTRNLLCAWALASQAEQSEAWKNGDDRRADEAGPAADILLWQDSDVYSSVADMVKLVRRLTDAPPDVAAVGAPCRLNDPDGEPSVNVNFNGFEDSMPAFWAGKCVEVAQVGFGLIACRASAYRALGFPWFEWKYVDRDIAKVCGEDMGWCDNVRALGYSIFADSSIVTTHVMQRPVKFDVADLTSERYRSR